MRLMSNHRKIWLAVLIVTAAVLAAGYTFVRPSQPAAVSRQETVGSADLLTAPAKPRPPGHDFVGSQSCTECHAAIAERYRSHPMSRSLIPVRELPDRDSQPAEVVISPPGHRRYRVRREAERMWHDEYLPDANGQMVYDQSFEVQYALGSGTRGRSFLAERGERLFASPINWYAKNGEWGLAPGYAPEFHKRFERETGDGCLVCHAGLVNFDRERPNVYQSPIFHESSIGCERCHGPGGKHIRFHQQQAALVDPAQKPSWEPVDSMVNPAKLKPAEREDVCNQCHLQGQSQQLRYGRSAFDFRPGMRLDDVWLIFISGDRVVADGRTRAVSQVEQMRSSVCFAKSNSRMGCLSCHDAHSVPTKSERADFYRQRCLTCHANSDCQLLESERASGPQQNSCVDCHMPSLGAADVPHTSQTDHRILRRQETTRTRTDNNHQTAVSSVLFDRAAERLSGWESRRSRGLLLAEGSQRTSSKQIATEAAALLEPIWQSAPDDAEVGELWGVTLQQLGKSAEARRVWETALRLHPHSESLLTRLAFYCHDTNDLRSAASYFERLFDINPWHAAFHGRQAHILGQLGEWKGSTQAAQRALDLDPTLSQVHDWLAKISHLKNDYDAAKFHEQRALQLRQAGF